MKIGFKTILNAVVIAGIIGVCETPVSAMPTAGLTVSTRADAPAAALKAETVYYRCGYYGCHRRYYGGYRRYYGGYRRPYYGGGYYRPGIGIGLGGVGIGIY